MKILSLIRLKLLTLIALLSFLSACLQEPHPSIAQQGHFEAVGVLLKCDNQTIKSYNSFSNLAQVQDTLFLTPQSPKMCTVNFLDTNINALAPPADPQKNLGLIASPDLNTLVTNWNFTISSKQAGIDSLRIVLNHVNHADFKSPWIIVITQSTEDSQ